MKIGKALLVGFVGLVAIIGIFSGHEESLDKKPNTPTSVNTNITSKPSTIETRQVKLLKEATIAVEAMEKDTTQENIAKAKQAVLILEDGSNKVNLNSRINTAIKKRDDELATKVEAEAKAKAEAEARARQVTRQPQQSTPQPQQSAISCPRNCTEARAMGMTNIPRGHVCYKRNLDRDGDGIGCDK